MKRPNQFETDPNNEDTLIRKQVRDDDIADATPEQIAQRKIVKVARREDAKEASNQKITLNIDFGVSSNEKTNPQSVNINVTQKIGSLFSNNSEEKTQPKKSNLFEGLNFGASLFNNNNKPTEAVKTGQTQKQSDKKEGQQNDKKQQKPSTSLFNFGALSGNISAPLFSNIFSNSSSSGGLFSSSGPSLFQFNTHVPPTSSQLFKKNNSDDQGDGEDDLAKQQSEQVDPNKVQNTYVYQNPYTKIVSKNLIKSKRDSDEVIENVIVSLEQYNENKNKYIFIRSKQTKKIFFQGQILPKISTVKTINNKSQNLNIAVVESKEGKTKIVSLKLQFLNEQDGEEFMKTLEDNIKNLGETPK